MTIVHLLERNARQWPEDPAPEFLEIGGILMIEVYFQNRLRAKGVDFPGNTHDDKDRCSRQECRVNKTAAVQMSCELFYEPFFMIRICVHLPVLLQSEF